MSSAKTKTLILEILKWLLVAGVIYLISLQLTVNKESNASFQSVSDAVFQSFDMSEVQLADNQMIKRLYKLDPSEYDDIVLYYPTTNMGAEELMIVKLKSLSQQETVKAAMESRIESQQSVFEGYAPEQYEMLGNGIVDVQGNYLILIVTDDPTAVQQAFRKAL